MMKPSGTFRTEIIGLLDDLNHKYGERTWFKLTKFIFAALWLVISIAVIYFLIEAGIIKDDGY